MIDLKPFASREILKLLMQLAIVRHRDKYSMHITKLVEKQGHLVEPHFALQRNHGDFH